MVRWTTRRQAPGSFHLLAGYLHNVCIVDPIGNSQYSSPSVVLLFWLPLTTVQTVMPYSFPILFVTDIIVFLYFQQYSGSSILQSTLVMVHPYLTHHVWLGLGPEVGRVMLTCLIRCAVDNSHVPKQIYQAFLLRHDELDWSPQEGNTFLPFDLPRTFYELSTNFLR